MNFFEILVECWDSFAAARKHKFLIVFTRSRQKIVILTRTSLHCINLVIKIPQDFNYLLQKLIPSSTRDLKTSKNASNSQTQQTPPSQSLFFALFTLKSQPFHSKCVEYDSFESQTESDSRLSRYLRSFDTSVWIIFDKIPDASWKLSYTYCSWRCTSRRCRCRSCVRSHLCDVPYC